MGAVESKVTRIISSKLAIQQTLSSKIELLIMITARVRNEIVPLSASKARKEGNKVLQLTRMQIVIKICKFRSRPMRFLPTSTTCAENEKSPNCKDNKEKSSICR